MDYPQVGRIVHWREEEGEPCRFAIVNARTDSGDVGLEVHIPAANGSRIEPLQLFVASTPSMPEQAGWHVPEGSPETVQLA